MLLQEQMGSQTLLFMPYKKSNGKNKPLRGVYELCEYISQRYKWENGKDVIGYFAEQQKEKRELVNIDTIWERAKCIVANTCISVGVNYQGHEFDRIFCYYTGWV